MLLPMCRYGLAAVQSPSAALCQYTSPAAKGTVYGTWTPAGTGNPPADDDTCRAALANGTQIDSAGEAVTTYACGCCGAINRRGEWAVAAVDSGTQSTCAHVCHVTDCRCCSYRVFTLLLAPLQHVYSMLGDSMCK
jgi:hypothetical protein